MTVLPRVLAAFGALALGLGGALVVAAPASAASLTVTKNVDDGLPGSLSYELGQLDPGVANTVTITATGTITGPTAGFPTISDDTTIVATNGPVTLLMDAAGGSLNVSGATVSIQDLDIVSDTPGSGQGVSVLDGSLSMTNVSVRDFDIGVFYVDSAGGHSIDLTDVDAGGTLANPSTLGIAIQDVDGDVALTRVAVSFTNGAGYVVGTSGGTVDVDTVSAEDGSGFQMLLTDTTFTAAHVSAARTLDGFSVFLDASVVDLTDLQVSDTDALGAEIDATNGSQVTVTSATISGSADSGIALEAEDSTIAATDVTAHDNGLVPGCGCGGGGSGIELYADNSTVTLTGADSHDNTAALGGGVYVGEASNGSTVTISGAAIADNTAAGGYGGGIDIADVEDAGTTVTIAGTTVSGNSAEFGGGIAARNIVAGAAVSITGSTTITDNHVTEDGGGIIVEGLVDDGSSFTLSDSTVTLNTSGDFGAGLYLLDIGLKPGGPISTAHVVVQRTTFDSNTAGGYGAGIAINEPAAETAGLPTVLIDSSTISNNTTPYGGGGIHIRRGSNGAPAVVAILNTTVTGNDAQTGGGIDVSAGTHGVGGGPGTPYVPGPDTLITKISQSTIADNSAHTSAGVAANSGDHRVVIENSILSGGTSNNGNTPNDFDPSPAFALSYSLVQAPRAGTVIPAGNITGVDPKLAALANNGGTTLTRMIAPGSPAYNAGDPAFAGAGLFDQRGQARVFERLDMGAVEWHPALALTGQTLTPGPPLVAFLLLFAGLAMVAFSRLQLARSVA